MITLQLFFCVDYVLLCRPTYSDLAEKQKIIIQKTLVRSKSPKKLIGVKLLQLSTQLNNHKANVFPQWRFTPTIYSYLFEVG
mgnify:CR=1 FL=1